MEEKQDRLPQMGVPCTVEQQVPGATKGEEVRSRHFTEDRKRGPGQQACVSAPPQRVSRHLQRAG